MAAKLDKLEDSYVTQSGRTVSLQIYVEPGKLDQSGFAMLALKKAMHWDEEVFGLELDLDQYMIVAVGDFNMGAMENKGLNIFNTKYVLARPDTATDTDFMLIDRVVAHEYFHNWTGNRVTCRDWFQLSLKEGLTVFRDQEFGADMYSRAVQRIQEVRGLRAAQFPEDAGPMAHPVRPQSYMEISNFYTATVYEKGAEVVRMIHTLIGRANFRKGMDLYFQRFDGQAVTTDDFAQAMQDASGVDLAQFKRWYDQAGTPVLEVSGTYDADAKRYTLTVKQSCPPSPGQPDKLPFHIPFAVGLVDADGKELPLRLEGEAEAAGTTRVLSLRSPEARYTFVDVATKPVPSLLRGFSAPVLLRYAYTDGELTHLMAHDNDAVNRWEAGQRLALEIVLDGIAKQQAGRQPDFPASFVDAFARVLADGPADPAFAADALSLPSEGYIAEQMKVVDPDAIHAVRVELRRYLARSLRSQLLATYASQNVTGPYSPDAEAAGRRALRNLCLGYLMELDDPEMRSLTMRQFTGANNMTDAMAALSTLANTDCAERQAALDAFYAKWKEEPLVVDKWLGVQASSRLPGTLGEVKRLLVARGLQHQESEQGVCADRRLPRQSGALPRGRRCRIRIPRGPGDRARRPQSDSGGAHGARLRPLEEVRHWTAGEGAPGARAHPRCAGVVEGYVRGRNSRAGMRVIYAHSQVRAPGRVPRDRSGRDECGHSASPSALPGWNTERSHRAQAQSAKQLISTPPIPNQMRPLSSLLAEEVNTGPIDNPPLKWRSPGPKATQSNTDANAVTSNPPRKPRSLIQSSGSRTSVPAMEKVNPAMNTTHSGACRLPGLGVMRPVATAMIGNPATTKIRPMASRPPGVSGASLGMVSLHARRVTRPMQHPCAALLKIDTA